MPADLVRSGAALAKLRHIEIAKQAKFARSRPVAARTRRRGRPAPPAISIPRVRGRVRGGNASRRAPSGTNYHRGVFAITFLGRASGSHRDTAAGTAARRP